MHFDPYFVAEHSARASFCGSFAVGMVLINPRLSAFMSYTCEYALRVSYSHNLLCSLCEGLDSVIDHVTSRHCFLECFHNHSRWSSSGAIIAEQTNIGDRTPGVIGPSCCVASFGRAQTRLDPHVKIYNIWVFWKWNRNQTWMKPMSIECEIDNAGLCCPRRGLIGYIWFGMFSTEFFVRCGFMWSFVLVSINYSTTFCFWFCMFFGTGHCRIRFIVVVLCKNRHAFHN